MFEPKPIPTPAVRVFRARPRADVDQAAMNAAFRRAFEKLRAGGPPPPRVVSAGPPHPRACTPLGDLNMPERQRAFDALRAGPPSPFQQLRELTAEHMHQDADIRAALRRARAARRPAWRPPVVHVCPASRPREGGARMVAASGRAGRSERGPPGNDDDGGGGSSDGDGGGSGSEPPPALACDIAGRAL